MALYIFNIELDIEIEDSVNFLIFFKEGEAETVMAVSWIVLTANFFIVVFDTILSDNLRITVSFKVFDIELLSVIDVFIATFFIDWDRDIEAAFIMGITFFFKALDTEIDSKRVLNIIFTLVIESDVEITWVVIFGIILRSIVVEMVMVFVNPVGTVFLFSELEIEFAIVVIFGIAFLFWESDINVDSEIL